MDKHVLVTGLSGSGKTYLSGYFRQNGINAHDSEEFNHLSSWIDRNGLTVAMPKDPTGQWLSEHSKLWDREKIKGLLRKNAQFYLFGYVTNVYSFIDLFNSAYYLRADSYLISQRLMREDRANTFGRLDSQRELILSMITSSEEKARNAGFKFIDASLTPKQIFDIITK
jgi:hypothetical protein